jgi:phosphoglycolate phosphatase-like HAD superfamily hydrolase
MRFLIDMDGPLVDIRPRLYALHKELIGETGLAPRPPEEFWQMIRRGEPLDRHLGQARPAHRDAYGRSFVERCEREDLLALDTMQPEVAQNLRVLKDMGVCHLITLRLNRQGAQQALDRCDICHFFDQLRVLSQVRSARIEQLKELAGGDPKTMVVTSSDSILIAARECSLFTVGIGNGPATPQRLRQAGADFVAKDLSELVDHLRPLSEAIRRAGWHA